MIRVLLLVKDIGALRWAPRSFPVRCPPFVTVFFALLTFVGTVPSAAADWKTIAVVESVQVPLLKRATDVFIESLGTQGYVDGETATIQRYSADGDLSRAAEILQDLLNGDKKPDLVVTVATLTTVAAKKALKETGIPHLFLFVADPVAAGLVSKVGETSDDLMTGISHEVSTQSKLDVAERILATRKNGQPMRLGLLHTSYPSSYADMESLIEAEDNYSTFSFVPLSASFQAGEDGREKVREEIVLMLNERAGEFDALWVAVGPMGADLVLFNRIQDAGHSVLFVSNIAAVKQGALFSILSNTGVNSVTASEMAARILSGVKANELPIVRPTDSITGVNLTTADKLGVIVPFDVLRLAAQNVYR